MAIHGIKHFVGVNQARSGSDNRNRRTEYYRLITGGNDMENHSIKILFE